MANWSDLPLDILTQFAKRLPDAEDFVRFGGVCKSWRVAAIHVKKGRRFSPWMMLSKLENDHSRGGVRTFCDLSTGKFFDVRLPQLQGKRCWGTQYGWLITFGIDRDIFLFHPLTQAKLCLPSQLKFGPKPDLWVRGGPINNCKNYIKKIAISSDPSHHSPIPIVMAAFGSSRLPAFASPGDEIWTTMTTPYTSVDMIFFKGHFYSVNPGGNVSVFSFNEAAVPHTMVIAPPPKTCHMGMFYLVEISESLYLINRSYEMDYPRKLTLCFNAYKMSFRRKKWIFSDHLKGHALFVGNNQTFAISPLDYPHFKPNCAYYTDDYNELRKTAFLDMGIFDYGNDTIIKSFHNCGRRFPASQLSGPVFFMPQLP